MQHELIDVLIVEDEHALALLHAELIGKHPGLRLVGIASSLADAQTQIESKRPQLVLLDNYLPDGKGITLIGNAMLAGTHCSVIFITAASDMDTCSLAIRNGAFDYILKPVSWKRLSQSLERFVQFAEQQREWKIVDQQNVDSLYQLQAKIIVRITAVRASKRTPWRGCKPCSTPERHTAFLSMKSSARRG